MPATQRRISKHIFIHVAREFLTPLVCALLAFAFLFLINNVFDDLGDFTSRKAPWHVILTYFLARQPHNLLNVIPISVLLASSFMTVMLGRNNELCAMRAAGLSLASCALPLWITATLAALVTFAISQSWGPASTQLADDLMKNYGKTKHKKAVAVALVNQTQHRDWFVHDQGDSSFSKVLVRQFDAAGNTLWTLAAKTATPQPDGTWSFANGTMQTYQDNRPSQQAQDFADKSLQLEEQRGDFKDMAATLDSVSIRQSWDLLNRPLPPPDKIARKLKTTIWYSLTFPLASIVAALFGFSMTIANQRSEAVRGFAASVGGLVLFYVVGQVFFVIGKNGWLAPFLAGALPNLLFTAAGLVNAWRKQ